MTPSINTFRSLLTVAFGSAVGALLFNTQPAIVGALAESFRFSEAELGTLIAIALLAVFALVVSSFFWVQRVPWRVVVTVGAGVASIGAAGIGIAEGYVGVAVSLSLMGVGAAAVYVVMLAMLAVSKDPTRAFGVAITLQVSVAALTVYLVPTLLLPHFGIAGVAGLFLLLNLLVFAVLPVVPRERISMGVRGSIAGGGLLGWALLSLGAMVIYFVGLNGTWAFLERIGTGASIPAEDVGVALATALVVGAGGSLCASALGRRLEVSHALVISGIGFIIFALIMVDVATFTVFLIGIVLFNAAWNFSLPYQMDLISRTDPDNRYIVLVPAAQTIGGAMGPAIAGPLLTSAGVTAVYVQMLFCIGIAFLVYAFVSQRLRNR